MGKGLAGVVARPIAGVVDATSNAFAGIHNELDIKAEIEQQRRPRVMDENPLQVYKERLAHAQDILWQLGLLYTVINITHISKVGCVFVSLLSHAGFGRNGFREDAPLFIPH